MAVYSGVVGAEIYGLFYLRKFHILNNLIDSIINIQLYIYPPKKKGILDDTNSCHSREIFKSTKEISSPDP